VAVQSLLLQLTSSDPTVVQSALSFLSQELSRLRTFLLSDNEGFCGAILPQISRIVYESQNSSTLLGLLDFLKKFPIEHPMAPDVIISTVMAVIRAGVINMAQSIPYFSLASTIANV